MKTFKLFVMLSFTLLLVADILSQPMVDIPLYAPDGTYIITLAVGLDPSATTGIDPQLGESDLPPFPPPPTFEIRFDLTWFTGEQLSSYKDYRYAVSPFVPDPIVHMLWWQLGIYGNPIEIQYELPYYAWMALKDHITNGELLNLGPFYGSGTASIPETYTNMLDRCYLIMHYDWLPVELTSFTASVLQNEKAVQLNWTTATETNNSGFEIERLQDSKIERLKNWETIGFVPGFGTTTEPKSYSFIDENVTTGIYKYRLKQIDFDGSFEYSNELEVAVDFTPQEFVLYQNYPNPFNPSTTIKYSLPVESNVRINIYNSLGEVIEELVSEMQNYGTYEIIWNAQNYSSGIYYYSFEVNSADGSQSHREMKKIVFLK